jgi:hypothetical protein
MNTSDLIGTVGVGLILLAYFCSIFQYISGSSRLFFGLNASGAALACYASFLILYWPFVVLEGIWMIVSLIAFFRVKKHSSVTQDISHDNSPAQ